MAWLIFCGEVGVCAEEIIHSVEPLGASFGPPRATVEQIEKSKTFDPGAPCPGLPVAADHLVKAGVYKSLDCLLQGDRFEYWQDDLNGQFLAILPTNAPPGDVRIVLESLTDGGKGTGLSQTTLKKSSSNKVTFLISMPSLKPGKYRVTAARLDEAGKPVDPSRLVGGGQAEYSFVKSDKRNPVVTIPAQAFARKVGSKAQALASSPLPSSMSNEDKKRLG